MKNKKTISVILAIVMAITLSLGTAVYATEGDTYLALGSDLSDSEKETVLSLLGVNDINSCNVIYVTNAEEHKYLDNYVDSTQIGSKALSSILIKEVGGDDIDVETHNIGYCTEGMYENALETAGVTGAEVVVAGPFEISGTAALVGTIKAYEQMTGKTVGDEVIEGAVDEITTTGALGEEIGNKDDAEDIIESVKEEIANNPDMSDEEIESAIMNAASEAGYDISQGSIDKIKSMAQNLQGLDIDWGKLKGILDTDKAQGFFAKIISWIQDLFD